MQRRILTTTITPSPTAPNYALVDLATAKDELQITDNLSDRWLVRAINQASTAVRNYCGRIFQVETIQDQYFPPQSSGAPWQVSGSVDGLSLSRFPVVSVTSIVTTDQNFSQTTLVAGTDFLVDLKVGLLTYLSESTGYPIPWPAYETAVIYEAGYPVVPPDVEEAVLRILTARQQGRSRDPMLKVEETKDLGRKEWWVPDSPVLRGNLPEDVASLLDSYRVPVIA